MFSEKLGSIVSQVLELLSFKFHLQILEEGEREHQNNSAVIGRRGGGCRFVRWLRQPRTALVGGAAAIRVAMFSLGIWIFFHSLECHQPKGCENPVKTTMVVTEDVLVILQVFAGVLAEFMRLITILHIFLHLTSPNFTMSLSPFSACVAGWGFIGMLSEARHSGFSRFHWDCKPRDRTVLLVRFGLLART